MAKTTALFLFILSAITLSAPGIAEEVKSVYAFKAQIKNLQDEVIYPAKIRPRIVAKIQSKIEGQVRRILKPIGSAVKKGEILAIISHTDPIYRFRSYKVRSTINGVIGQHLVDTGGHVRPGQPMFILAGHRDYKVNIELLPNDKRSISKNTLGSLKIGSDGPFKVRILGISSLINPATGGHPTQLKLRKRIQLPPGDLGQVTFFLNKRTGFTIPERALNYQGDKIFVFKIANKIISKEFIKVGKNFGDMIEVTNGLKDGDVIVEKSSRFLKEGDEVKVEKERS